MSSIAAYQPAPPLAMYAVSKTALLGLVKALAGEVRCNMRYATCDMLHAAC